MPPQAQLTLTNLQPLFQPSREEPETTPIHGLETAQEAHKAVLIRSLLRAQKQPQLVLPQETKHKAQTAR